MTEKSIVEKLENIVNKYFRYLETRASKEILLAYHNEVINLLKKEELIK